MTAENDQSESFKNDKSAAFGNNYLTKSFQNDYHISFSK